MDWGTGSAPLNIPLKTLLEGINPTIELRADKNHNKTISQKVNHDEKAKTYVLDEGTSYNSRKTAK